MNNIGIIHLRNGGFALVDIENYEYLNQWKWYRSHKGYIRRNRKVGEKGPQSPIMHRIVNKTLNYFQTDHKNGYKFDNRKINLRDAVNGQNTANKLKYKCRGQHCSSVFKGVCWNKQAEKWMAYVGINKKSKFLGYYEDEMRAARAYNIAALFVFNQFSRLNESCYAAHG